MFDIKANLLLLILSQICIAGASTAASQDQRAAQLDVLTPSERGEVSAVASAIAKHINELEKKANARIMGRLAATERNTKLACTLAWSGSLREREGNDVGVVSFVNSDSQNDPALLQLVTFPSFRLSGEYGFHYFDVAVWPNRRSPEKGRFAVRIEMRQGLYWDWADSHITDDSLGKDWWRPLVAPECK